MIMIDLNYTVDLARPVEPKTLTGPLYYGDEQAHRVNVKVLRNGVAVDLTGVTCYGYLVWEELNETFELEPEFCSVSAADSTASVILPKEAYLHTGRCYLIVQLEEGDSLVTVLALYGQIVHGITGIIVIPETSHLDIHEIEEMLTEIRTAIENANAAKQSADAAAEAARTAALTAVTYAEQTGKTDAEKSQARTNIEAARETDMLAMADKIKYWTIDRSGMTNRGITVSRVGATALINGTATGTGTQGSDFRLTGDATYGNHTAIDLGQWASLSPVTVRSGVKYRFRAELISGTMTAVQFGMYDTTGAALFARIDPTVCSEVTFTGNGLQACIMIYTAKNIGSTADNAVVVVSLEENPADVAIEDVPFEIGSNSAFVDATTGAATASSAYSRTGFINVTGYSSLIYSRLNTTASTSTGGMAFYTAQNASAYLSGQAVVTGQTDYSYTDTAIPVPTGARYARFSIRNDLSGFRIRGVRAQRKSLAGAKLSLLGDSMSAYEGYIYEGNKPYYNGTRGNVYRVDDMWWKKLCDRTGMEPLVIDAWSGSGVCYNYDAGEHGDPDEGSGVTPMCSVERTGRLSENGVTPDVILVAGGTNDFTYANSDNGQGVPTTPLGSWDGKTAIDVTAVDAGDSTFMESYATMIRRLQTNYPNAIIACMSCYYTWRGTKASDGCQRLNAVGNSAVDYNNAIRTVCGYLGVPYIDVYSVGFTDSNYYPTYAQDSATKATHTNAAGQAVLSRRIQTELERLASGLIG